MGSFDPRQLCNASVVLDEGLTAIVKTGNGGIGPPQTDRLAAIAIDLCLSECGDQLKSQRLRPFALDASFRRFGLKAAEWALSE